MKCCYLVIALLIAIASGGRADVDDLPSQLQYAPAPVDNPLKGLVPYQGDVRNRFPHSMEFTYLPYSALVKGYDTFDWNPLDEILNDIANRGHQAVIRVFLEYPGKAGAIPVFLVKDGLKTTKWVHTETQPHPAAVIETPDYKDTNLRRSLKSFIAAFGKRYDGDPRLGFLTAGLLGIWGEWHTYPREELFANKVVQSEVMNAYEAAFKTTPVLLRYPAGADDKTMAKNADRKFGYHDDSFAWATLHTGKVADGWYFMTILKAAGPEAESKWITHPIGGEIRPEAWGKVFDDRPELSSIQDFRSCVEATHATWMMDSGMFAREPPVDRLERAMTQVRRMGYEFHVPDVVISRIINGKLDVKLKIENRGVAPFYYNWRPEYGLLANDEVMMTSPGTGKLTGLLPGGVPRLWADTIDMGRMKAGTYTLAVRVPNPLVTGKPLRFANTTQSDAPAGWLWLGEVVIPR